MRGAVRILRLWSGISLAQPLAKSLTLQEIAGYARLILKDGRSTFNQAFAALFICAVAELFAGSVMGGGSRLFILLPGLIIIIPGAIGMRGYIFAALSSRVGTGLHLGLLSTRFERSKVLDQNIYSAVILSVVTSVYLGVVADIVCIALGLGSIGVVKFVVISLIGGTIAGVFLLITSIFVSLKSFEGGWDPDNVSTPLVTAAGDVITLPSIFIAAEIVLFCDQIIVDIIFAASILLFIACIALILARDDRIPITNRIVQESTPVFAVCGFISILSGTILHGSLEAFILMPGLLVLVIPFLEEGGNLGTILAAKSSSGLHAGTLNPRLRPEGRVLINFAVMVALAVIIFPIVGALAHAACVLSGLESPGLLNMVAVSITAGLIITVIADIVSYYLTIASFRIGVDPDNVVIPVITSVMDFAGVACLIMVMLSFGLI